MLNEVGLRERKKIECRRVIAASARELAAEGGIDGFTVDDIAERAHVSPRTFFNYFASKEDAIIGIDPSRIEEMTARLQARPRRESPLTALRGIFLEDSDDLEASAAGFAAKIELVHRYPQLMSRHLATTYGLEKRLIGAMAARLEVDPTVEPYPTIVVTVGVAALRSTMLWWFQNGRPGNVVEHIEAAFMSLSQGLRRPPRQRRPATSV